MIPVSCGKADHNGLYQLDNGWFLTDEGCWEGWRSILYQLRQGKPLGSLQATERNHNGLCQLPQGKSQWVLLTMAKQTIMVSVSYGKAYHNNLCKLWQSKPQWSRSVTARQTTMIFANYGKANHNGLDQLRQGNYNDLCRPLARQTTATIITSFLYWELDRYSAWTCNTGNFYY